MIPIPDEDKSLYDPDHIFDQISMYVIVICLSIDVIYYITSILFVRMWYEPQPSFLRICQTLGTHYILYWMIVLDVYVYSRTVHYTNNININLRNRSNDTILTTIVMVGIMCTSISLVVFMTYHKLQHTRRHIIEGGPPLPVETLQEQYHIEQQQQPQSDPAQHVPPMIIVITGANAGIGKETVRLLHQILTDSTSTTTTTSIGSDNVQPNNNSCSQVHKSAKILLLCRNIDKGQEAIQDILSSSTNTTTTGTSSTGPINPSSSITMHNTTRIQQKQCQLQVVPCDLCSFRSVRNAVDEILNIANYQAIVDDRTNNITDSSMSTNDSVKPSKDRHQPKVIHTLINNAGVMMSQLTYTDEDHHETCIQANFLGHFLLSSLLLPYISTSIINVTSSTYQLNVRPLLIQPPSGSSRHKHYSWNDDDIQCRGNSRRKFSLFGQYAITKWCNILHTVYLSKYYSHLLYSSSIHPGLVRTDVTRNMPYYLRIPNSAFAIVLQTLQKTPIQGAWNTIHVFALAAKWYKAKDIVDTVTAPTESSSLQRKQQRTIRSQYEPDIQNISSGQYWVNRQPQPISAHGHYATRIEEQAEAVWDWALQQVQLTDAEIQQLHSLKTKMPSTAVVDDDATNTSTTNASSDNHSKVD